MPDNAHVPDPQRRASENRAAPDGLSLTRYLERQYDDLASRTTMTELLERAEGIRDGGVDRERIVTTVRERREEHDG